MSVRRTSSRAAIGLFTTILLTASAFAASGWSELFTTHVPFLAASFSRDKKAEPITAMTIGVCSTAGPVEVESTAGTTSPTTYATLKAAFDAVNAGTHQGVVSIEVCANTTEGTTPATLNGSGQGSALYTALSIVPLNDGLSITGNPAAGFGVIQLKGADNVTIDGDDPNTPGTNRNLTINNTNTPTAIAGSVIRIATASTATSADNISLKNLILTGNVTGGNAAGITLTTGSSNSSFGIYVGGNGGSTATDAPTAITSVSSQPIPAATTVNNLLVDNNSISQTARGIEFNGNATAQSSGVTITNNDIGNPVAGAATGVYSMGMTVQGTASLLVRQNTVYAESFIAAGVRGIDIGSISANISGVTIERNQVRRATNNNPATWGAYGINLQGGSTHIVRNNFVSGIRNDQTAGTAGFDVTRNALGIRLAGGTDHKIYHNSIHLVGTVAGTMGMNVTAALAVNGTSRTGMDIRNNIFSNQLTGGNPVDANTRHACVFMPSGGSAMNTNWNNNNYFQGPNTSGALSLIGQVGLISGAGEYFAADFDPTTTTPATNFRSYTVTISVSGNNDNASRKGDPLFVSATNLHITPSSPIVDAGANIAVTDDVDGDSRPTGAGSEIGADEVLAAVPVPGTLQLSSATYSANESAGNVVMLVTRTTGSDGPVSADVTLADGTATGGAACAAGVDYVHTPQTVSFAAGDSSPKVVNVPICGDALDEADEAFTATLVNPSGGATVGSPASTTNTIIDDDAGPAIVIGDVAQVEGNAGTAAFTFTVNLMAVSGLQVSVNYATMNGTATSASGDYQPTNGTLTIPAGSTSGTIAVTVNGDTVPEGDEAFAVNLSGGFGYDAAGSDLQGQGTILNDDAAEPAKALWVFGDSVVPHPVTTAEGRQALVARSSAAGVNRLYVSVWQSTPNTTSGRHMREDADVAALIATAHAAGQEVWAAYGDPAWPAVTAGCPAGSSPVIYMGEVGAYNASRPANERFDGVMLDVEPNPVTEADFQALIAHHECMRVSLDPSIKLGSAISAFWDDDAVMYPPALGGVVKPAAHHLIDLDLDQIVVMGYRDNAGTACSANGIICLDQNEIAYATSIGKPGFVLAGLETISLSPAEDQVTFFEEGNAAMDTEAENVENHFSASIGFGGFAIHNYNASFLSGLPGWPTFVPTAANSALDGRVSDAGGAALANVMLTIEGGGLTRALSTRTNSFGNYTFDGLPTGYVYFVTVSSRRYAFANPMQVVSVYDNVSGVDFAASASQ